MKPTNASWRPRKRFEASPARAEIRRGEPVSERSMFRVQCSMFGVRSGSGSPESRQDTAAPGATKEGLVEIGPGPRAT
jgi:hypothetical protein